MFLSARLRRQQNLPHGDQMRAAEPQVTRLAQGPVMSSFIGPASR
jgi:hypothetical protein